MIIQVIKKDGTLEDFNKSKIIKAINKSAERVVINLTEEEKNEVCKRVYIHIAESNIDVIEVEKLHNIVEVSLESVNKKVAKSYREYRNYKRDFINILDEVYQKAQSIMYRGDKENSNTDSSLVSTKRSLIYNELNKELYNKFFLTTEEKQACRDGYIYVNDKSSRRDTMNCCLYDPKTVMSGGFEMGNIWYTEPKSIDTACDVLGDIIMNGASMQYGGFSIGEIDKLLAPYVEKSHNTYINALREDIQDCSNATDVNNSKLEDKALNKAVRDLEQGIQGLEIKLNSVGSSRGDYPFVTFSTGEGTSKYEILVTEAMLKVRKNGQGKEGFKKCVLFPKIVFLYVEDLHGEGKTFEYLYDQAISCSGVAMYPDYLSLTGDGYVAKMYQKYNKIITPMG